MEDLRLVRFVADEGTATFYGTYTAYDGHRTHPMLLETTDFCTFHVSTLSGRYVRNKGMALARNVALASERAIAVMDFFDDEVSSDPNELADAVVEALAPRSREDRFIRYD